MSWIRRQFARGAKTAREAVTFYLGEPVVEKTAGADFGRLFVGDGATAGGRGLAFKDEIPGAVAETVKTASYTVLSSDAGSRLIGNSASAITFTLPAGAGGLISKDFRFKNVSTGDLTVARAGSDTIEGATSIVLSLGDSATLSWTGSLWRLSLLRAEGHSEPETSIAAAATIDLGASNTERVAITGTATVTSFGARARQTRRVRVLSAGLVLTHNATSLILPNGVDITTRAGDTFRADGDGSGNWRVSNYQRAPEPLFPGVTAPITVGYTFVAYDLGTVTSGTVTPDPTLGNHQRVINNGAFTLAAWTAVDSDLDLDIINGPSAGAVTPSGFQTNSNTGETYPATPRANATATMTIASPGVVTWNAHGIRENMPLWFTTTGVLPTGLTANTVYFAKNVTTNTFQVSATPRGAAINTTGTQSGTHTCYAASVYKISARCSWGVNTYTGKALT